MCDITIPRCTCETAEISRTAVRAYAVKMTGQCLIAPFRGVGIRRSLASAASWRRGVLTGRMG